MTFNPSNLLQTATAALLVWSAAQLFENSRDITANAVEIKANRQLIERLEKEK